MENIELGVGAFGMVGAEQPPPVIVSDHSGVQRGHPFDEGGGVLPSLWEVNRSIEPHLTRLIGLGDAVDLAIGL